MDSSAQPDWENPHNLLQILQYLPGMSIAAFQRLRHSLGDLTDLWQQPVREVQALLPSKTRRHYAELRSDPQSTEAVTQWQLDQMSLQRQGVETISWHDQRYPPLLKEIHQPPPVLYVLGDPDCLSDPQLALVGSRNMTPNGSENAYRFAHYLAQAGLVVTSGLATGVDAQAHRGALQAEGKTVAVMATGIDRLYPPRHQTLADDIVRMGGCLVTEFRPGTPPLPRHFPTRNRIVSGLSLGVLVVEAATKSGSLITARLAMEQNREVFAIPGSIHNPQARGCHQLIRQGATLVESGLDIAEQLQGWVRSSEPTISSSLHEVDNADLEVAEQQLLQWIGYDFMTLDQLGETSGWSTEKLLSKLMSLQLKGIVVQQGAGYQRL